jgi:hypothetical protein
MVAMITDRRPAWRWAGIVGVVVLLLCAVERVGWRDQPVGIAELRPASLPASLSSLPRSYDEALARLDLRIADARARADAGPDQWLLHEAVAHQYLARARLSGSYDDYAAAQAALDRAFAVAVAGSGPHMLRARLDFNMHRLAAAERQLTGIDRYAVPPSGPERADISAMRGDIAFYRGNYAAARGLYDEADRLAPGAASFRRAIQASRFGQVGQAEALFNRSEQGQQAPLPQDRAYFELQRGILDLDRDRLDDALVHFRRADGIFPGHWLIEEHIAEVTTLKGDLPAASACTATSCAGPGTRNSWMRSRRSRCSAATPRPRRIGSRGPAQSGLAVSGPSPKRLTATRSTIALPRAIGRARSRSPAAITRRVRMATQRSRWRRRYWAASARPRHNS